MDFFGQLSPSKTTALLGQLGHVPDKRLGQNFLIDANIVRKSLDFAEIKEGDIVVEVGPGLGTLTGALLERGAFVYAVELDKKLFAHLSKLFAGEKNVNLLNADALEKPFGNLPESERNFKIAANLPYAISTPWMDFAVQRAPQRMSLMLQKEAASRFSAKGKSADFCPISILVNSAYDVDNVYKVSASCFYPRPNVDSALLSLKIKETPFFFKKQTKGCIRRIFSQRRKQIGSIVKGMGNSYVGVEDWLALVGDTKLRPEVISLELWQKLDSYL